MCHGFFFLSSEPCASEQKEKSFRVSHGGATTTQFSSLTYRVTFIYVMQRNWL